MAKLLKAAVYVFAVIGVIMTAGVGYVYATNSQLMGEFWSVKEDFRAVPSDRRTEVVAELPARITFEKEVAAEMAELPEERRSELYDQLKKSREQVYDQFKARITAEAGVAREAKKAQKDVKQVAEEIEKQLGKVNVGIDLTGTGRSAPDNLADVNKANAEVAKARLTYGESLESTDGAKRVKAAVGVLEALDKLADKVQAARKKNLSADEKDRLGSVVTSAKADLFTAKNTPNIQNDPKAKKLMVSIPQKLNE
ncbi:MAG: hypothetical protein H6840_04365 [Planctomycetes bacterium]|nr:hypothetical protein [Planctomycetota bacterium]